MDTKLENLWKLHASAWASFQRRADHEFRFSVAVWTAAAALIGLGLKKGYFQPRLSMCCAIFLAVVFVALHLWYEYGMAQSNDMDLNKCYYLESTIMNEIGHRWSAEVKGRIDRHKEKGWLMKNWSHLGHVGITAVLVTIAVFLLYTTPSQSGGKEGKTTISSPGGHDIDPTGSRTQELKALREAVPGPMDKHRGNAAPPQETTNQPNKSLEPTGEGRGISDKYEQSIGTAP